MPVGPAVLDSFALLAYFRGESAGLRVREFLEQAAVAADQPLCMTEVNYAEVKYVLLKKDGADAWERAEDVLHSLPLQFYPADRGLADLAAEFKTRVSFSLADAFAAALAKKLKAPLVTGDPEFKAVEREIKIVWLR